MRGEEVAPIVMSPLLKERTVKSSKLSTKKIVLSVINIIALSGCGDSSGESDSSAVETEFQESMQLLSEAYGQQGKMDFSSIIDPCTLLEPLRNWARKQVGRSQFEGAVLCLICISCVL